MKEVETAVSHISSILDSLPAKMQETGWYLHKTQIRPTYSLQLGLSVNSYLLWVDLDHGIFPKIPYAIPWNSLMTLLGVFSCAVMLI